MSDKITIGQKPFTRAPELQETLSELKDRPKDDNEVKTIVEALKNSTSVDPKDYETVLQNMGIPEVQYKKFLNPEPVRPAPVESTKKHAGTYNLNSMKKAEKLFEASTQELDLPSKGVFYPNGQSTLKVKGLTAKEDDILHTAELISQNKVLHAILESAIVDDKLRPENMLACDRSYVLIQLRIDGFGSEYEPGPMGCDSCGNVYHPKVDLSLLKVKELKHMPDQEGMYFVELPMSKVKLRFRLLNGKDELALQNKGMAVIKNTSGYKSKKIWSERYLLQIMEVNGERDKIFIKSFIDAMPLGDSQFFRKHAFEVEPGIDLNYNFTCDNCGHEEEKLVPITPRLFYPDADL
jgi:hypothetical protein